MSALRALRQLSACSGRAVCGHSAVRAASGLSVVARTTPFVQSARAFSVSAGRLGQGKADVALSQKLQEELTFETENTDSATPEFLKELTSKGIWKIEETPGQDEVAPVRSFENEEIRIMFSIADIREESQEEFDEDGENEESSEEEEEVLHNYPIRTSMTITKPGQPGSLSVDMLAQEGNFLIENVTYYPDEKTATELSAEADFKRRGLYMGPPFDNLDVGLQEQFESFLQERGVNESIALFIPEYAEHKEQNEYVQWLKGVKKFIDQ